MQRGDGKQQQKTLVTQICQIWPSIQQNKKNGGKTYILVLHLEVGYEGPGVPLQVEGGEDELVEGAAALVDQVEELPVIRPRLQVAGEQPERRVLAYHHYYHCIAFNKYQRESAFFGH